MRTWLVTLLMLLVTLAGCSDEGTPETPVQTETPQDTPEETTTQETTTQTESQTSTTSTEAPQTSNTAPEADLAADAVTGEAPLNVTFTVDGLDADGDALTWTLDADGDGTVDANGTSLPGTAAFLFETAGNFTATLSVTDGEDTATAMLNVTILEPVVVEEGPEPIVYTGGWVANPTGCALVGGTAYDGITQGVALVSEATWGGEFSMLLSVTGDGLGGDVIIQDGSGNSLGSVTADLDAPAYGVMPEGASRLIFRICGAGDATYELNVTPVA